MLFILLTLIGSDFPISTAQNSQRYPGICYANNIYYVFWVDKRFYGQDSTTSLYGSRVSKDGVVIDPDGKLLFRDDVGYELDADFDGENLLVVFRNHC
ncbi:hypothetical protein BXT86_05795 [candidate division WOR-3 bacterium 4484_100]|uniref:Phytase-like domain-containing protein n=1 Tax=candidate division WOR-3 bacterium 4484_100 TaxID=1936077 RepID=A0A1V4QEY3_UNCW3|nr:MAG: hypothetical protein BXT86_05795 [candidate division WOR-3 bacterium 4484_100]